MKKLTAISLTLLMSGVGIIFFLLTNQCPRNHTYLMMEERISANVFQVSKINTRHFHIIFNDE